MKTKLEKTLAAALLELVSQQSGPPSPCHANEWSVAMNMARSALKQYYGVPKCERR